jgi:SAM-dependent methyltransferase
VVEHRPALPRPEYSYGSVTKPLDQEPTMTTEIHGPTFDPAQYKTTTREQWNAAAQAWHRWAPNLRSWLGPATERMLDLAGVETGGRVLDVAAGAGDQTLQIASRVGPEGRVLATDLSPEILAFAAAEAKRANYANVLTQAMDGEHLSLDDASFDVVVSRVGLIYFPDQQRALREMRRVLVPGGRVAAIVYSTADQNGFFSVPVSIVRRHAKLGAPLPGQPGPFSLGGPGVIEDAFTRAGFVDVRAERVSAPLRLKSAAECLRFEQESFGALHQMLGSLPSRARDEAWHEVGTALRDLGQTTDGFVGPCELVIAVGTRPESVHGDS